METDHGSNRSGDGRFAPGNPGGPGRPRRAVEADYLKALAEACPPETFLEICQRAVDQARDGEPRARAWLADYLVGTRQPGALIEIAAREVVGRTSPFDEEF